MDIELIKKMHDKVETKEAIVAFIDILGFSEYIKAYDKGELPEVLNDLKEVLYASLSMLKSSQHSTELIRWKENIDIKLFSDNLCVAVPTKDFMCDFHNSFILFYLYLTSYQNLLMERGYFVRGGVSIGSYYSDETMIFSGGMLEAVELEKNAIYPRIVISKGIVEQLNKTKSDNLDLYKLMITIDESNTHFLNNFKSYDVESLTLEKALDQITIIGGDKDGSMKALLKSTGIYREGQNEKDMSLIEQNFQSKIKEFSSNKKVLLKYIWLQDFFNYSTGKSSSFSFLDFE
jgi:hypothetical protein